jgi:hypothetical protein
MVFRCYYLVAFVLLIAPVQLAFADLIIDPTFDDAQMSADGFSAGQIAQIHTAFNYAAGEFQSKFLDNIHVNINVTSGPTGLGQSTTSLLGFLTYNQVKTFMSADSTTTDDATAFNSMSVADPTGSDKFFVARAQAKALGIIGDDAVTDGTFTFSNAANYTFDPNNRAVAGAFDFIGIAEHEISEIMGRFNILGSLSAAYAINDLYRYTANGVHSLVGTNAGSYLSIDGGATSLVALNTNPSGDFGDYAGAVATDPFNAFTGANQDHLLNSVDFTNMDVIGYDLKITAVPEPSAFVLLAIGGSVFLFTRRRANTITEQ